LLQNVITTVLTRSEHVNASKKIGNRGEATARRYLKRLGWRLIAKNLCFGNDELDILAVSPCEKILAIVEVRTTEDALKKPESTLTKKKRTAMLRVAKRLNSTAIKHSCELRVDLIAVRINGHKPTISHYEGIFLL
jgi:Holliday junction resolvase-like predicted endonuclease